MQNIKNMYNKPMKKTRTIIQKITAKLLEIKHSPIEKENLRGKYKFYTGYGRKHHL